MCVGFVRLGSKCFKHSGHSFPVSPRLRDSNGSVFSESLLDWIAFFPQVHMLLPTPGIPTRTWLYLEVGLWKGKSRQTEARWTGPNLNMTDV